jgi:uncharacterized protein (UPF0216 family)
VDQGPLDRWFALEMRALQQGLVKVAKPLADLVAEEAPSAVTAGGPYYFDRAALRALHDALPLLTRHRLRLPILVLLDKDVPGNGTVLDRTAQEALVELGLTPTIPRDGKLWASELLLRDAARRFPTCFQFAYV